MNKQSKEKATKTQKHLDEVKERLKDSRLKEVDAWYRSQEELFKKQQEETAKKLGINNFSGPQRDTRGYYVGDHFSKTPIGSSYNFNNKDLFKDQDYNTSYSCSVSPFGWSSKVKRQDGPRKKGSMAWTRRR